MTDSTSQADTPSPAPEYKIEAEKIIHSVPHKLVHLEAEFLEEWHKLFTGMEATARRLLAFIASKV